MYLDNKLVFVAGSTGLVGSSIVRYILKNCPKTTIRASIYRTNSNIINDKRIEYMHGDLRCEDHCIKISKDCDCVIMAAANASGSNILVNDPWQQVNDNIIMNAQMLRAFCDDIKIKRIIYISSSTVYQPSQELVKECDLDLNQDPHKSHFGIGWTMRFTEKLCKLCHEQYNKEIIIVRASNIFGPYAKFNPSVSNFIPAIIRKAVNKTDPFEIWGYPDVIRDVLYADDLARAILIMINDQDIKFDTFNIGYGIGVSIDNIANLILKYTEHKPSKIIYAQSRPTTVRSRILNCSKAKNVIGWNPKYTIEEGIKNTIDWWIKNKDWWEE